MKKFLCIALALIMLLSLAACGKKSTEKLADKDGAYYFGSEEGIKKLQESFNPLNPTNVYSNLTFDERMLYGRYEIPGGEKAMEKYAKEAAYADLEYSDTYSLHSAEENVVTKNLTTMPVKIDMGPSANSYYGRLLRGEHEWAELTFISKEGYEINVLCTYTVSGNTVSFTPLDGYEAIYKEGVYKTEKIIYIVGKDSLDYTFSFHGNSLTLTRDGQNMTLKTWYFSGNSNSSPSIGGYLAEGSPSFDNVDHFSGTLYNKKESLAYAELRDGTDIYESSSNNFAIKYTDDGQISFYWESKDDAGNVTEHLHHFIYFPGDGYTMTLTDGKQVYYYTESYTSREAVALGEGMTAEELSALKGLDDAQLEQIAKKKADLLSDLAKAYEEAGLKVSINTTTGEIALDSTVLFDVNEYAISDEGKTFLQKFTQIYTSVVYGDTYADFVSRVIVEGHTDTNGSYDMNLELSQNRANSVKDYCVSAECGVDSAYAAQFGNSLEAEGYSYDKPVYGADGSVDMEASRRVSFRFIVSLDKYAQN